jgi:hypothetical protein
VLSAAMKQIFALEVGLSDMIKEFPSLPGILNLMH